MQVIIDPRDALLTLHVVWDGRQTTAVCDATMAAVV